MLTVNELFSGIGSQRAALERLGIEHKVVGIAEIDKFAIKSYEAIWGPTKNYGDISKVEKLDYADFWTYSFPCQDISVAGKQAGIEKGKTRSGLLYEVERLLEVAQEHNELPKYLMLENVKNLVGKKFKPQFEEWIERLDELGYNTYWQVLNAKNYGIPQNRERVFGISIRKDIDTGYVFPEPFELKTRLKDILEDEVDEKFYINNDKSNKLINKLNDTNQLTDIVNPCDGTINEPKVKDISNCIKARYDCGVSNLKSDGTMVVETLKQKRVGGLYDGETKHQAGSVWDTNYIAPTVDTMQGGNRQPCIIDKVQIKQATKKGYPKPQIQKVDIPQTVTVRKHEVDIEKLRKVLRTHKNLTNKEIAERLDRPITLVEHWFRKDKSFSIPDADVWFKLKELLNITTNEFDLPITEFIEQDGVYEKANRCYITTGISPTLTSASADEKILEPVIAASRGRNPNNPSDRTPGSPTEQRLEVNKNGTSNMITTVQKDNYVLEPNTNIPFVNKRYKEFIDEKGYMPEMFNPYNCTEINEVAPTRLAQGDSVTKSDTVLLHENYRIRKLTPKECWRLMGFTDEQFQKAQDAGVSNTQLYKQAGNSIVVDVLYYLFKSLFIDKPKYKIQISNEEQLPGQMNILDYL